VGEDENRFALGAGHYQRELMVARGGFPLGTGDPASNDHVPVLEEFSTRERIPDIPAMAHH
jgi:hypothetical protein